MDQNTLSSAVIEAAQAWEASKAELERQRLIAAATKLIEVEVRGALNNQEAVQVAKSIVGSSLVKTAVYGADANWGRIIAAVGYSGATVDPEKIDASIGPIQLLKNSQPTDYSEEEATEYLQNDTVKISVDLHVGSGCGKAWGCDLTYDYVRINASYRS